MPKLDLNIPRPRYNNLLLFLKDLWRTSIINIASSKERRTRSRIYNDRIYTRSDTDKNSAVNVSERCSPVSKGY